MRDSCRRIVTISTTKATNAVLTYMSICAEMRAPIFRLIRAKRLARLRPSARMDPVLRCVIVTEEVANAVLAEQADDFMGDRLAEFRAMLDGFVAGWEIGVADDPYNKHPDTMLARIAPEGEEVWDIRVLQPMSGIRCFGRFVGPDAFLALTWQCRESVDWDYERDNCIAAWRGLFGTTPPYQGTEIDDYLSCNFFVTSP